MRRSWDSGCAVSFGPVLPLHILVIAYRGETGRQDGDDVQELPGGRQ